MNAYVNVCVCKCMCMYVNVCVYHQTHLQKCDGEELIYKSGRGMQKFNEFDNEQNNLTLAHRFYYHQNEFYKIKAFVQCFKQIIKYFYVFILFFPMCYICVCFQLVAFVREHIWHKALLMGYSMRLELTHIRSFFIHIY